MPGQRIRGGLPYTETTQQRWCWISTLDPPSFPARVVWYLGHLRWKNENNGWNDLSQNFALKHGFLHDCKHRPKTLSAEGKPEPVANHGLAAVALIRCLAFNLFSAFVRLHSKLFRRYQLAVAEVSASTASFVVETLASDSIPGSFAGLRLTYRPAVPTACVRRSGFVLLARPAYHFLTPKKLSSRRLRISPADPKWLQQRLNRLSGYLFLPLCEVPGELQGIAPKTGVS